ncbi:MAG TPA: MFS transporter, partial [Steroidobacteraceae bacterium]|nr:MFS transporter [Steroidobacteraceae bacterium]
MKFLANPHINRLAAHSTLHQLAWYISGVFFGVFLLKAGIAPAVIFLSIAGIRVVRFALRPLVLLVIPAIGLRRTMMLATVLFALQYPALAFVDGPGPALLVVCAITALGEGFYFTCYHALFAALGDAEHRGSQLGVRQGLGAVASVVGPVAGGLALVAFGPWAAFGLAALAEIAAVLPLRD